MHPLVAAGTTTNDPTIDAAETGQQMLAGTENVPIGDADAAFDPNNAGVTYYNDRAPIVGPSSGPPALPEPAPDRAAFMPKAFTVVEGWGGIDDQALRGQHGEVVTGAAMPPGLAMTNVPLHGNTWRLTPDPWDSPFWVAQAAPEGAHGP